MKQGFSLSNLLGFVVGLVTLGVLMASTVLFVLERLRQHNQEVRPKA